MAYHKTTSISGRKHTGEFKPYCLPGHWKLDAAARFARRHGITSAVKITHNVHDMSGHSRGGHDGMWWVEATADGRVTSQKTLASWSEFGKEHD